jgi:hypothetical protein
MEDGTKSSPIRHFWMRQPRAERADKIADADLADREEHQTDERH